MLWTSNSGWTGTIHTSIKRGAAVSFPVFKPFNTRPLRPGEKQSRDLTYPWRSIGGSRGIAGPLPNGEVEIGYRPGAFLPRYCLPSIGRWLLDHCEPHVTEWFASSRQDWPADGATIAANMVYALIPPDRGEIVALPEDKRNGDRLSPILNAAGAAFAAEPNGLIAPGAVAFLDPWSYKQVQASISSTIEGAAAFASARSPVPGCPTAWGYHGLLQIGNGRLWVYEAPAGAPCSVVFPLRRFGFALSHRVDDRYEVGGWDLWRDCPEWFAGTTLLYEHAIAAGAEARPNTELPDTFDMLTLRARRMMNLRARKAGL